MNTVDDIKRRLQKKSAQIQAFMNSELGKSVIEALEEEFYHGELFDSCERQTAYNLGRRDVVVFLKQLQNWKK